MIPDPLIALRTVIAADAGVVALAAARVYAGELLRTDASLMPRYAVVIRDAGGPSDDGLAPVARQLVEVFTYGATPLHAKKLSQAVHDALKSLRRAVANSTVLHSVTLRSGPMPGRDDRGDWPLVRRVYEVLAGELEVAA